MGICKINFFLRRRRQQRLDAQEDREKIAPNKPDKPKTFLIAPGFSVYAGNLSDAEILAFKERYRSPRPRESRCDEIPSNNRFKFTGYHETTFPDGRTYKFRKMIDTQKMSCDSTTGDSTTGDNLNDFTSPPTRGILYPTFGIGAKTKSKGLDDEQTSFSLASCIEEIAKHVELLKQELPKPYTSRHCLKWADLLFSWIPKTGALPPYEQVSGECWAVALQRGRAYYMAANGIEGKELTIQCLLDNVSRKHLLSSGGLIGFECAKDFMVANGYVKDMIVHRRPSEAAEIAGYEILLEKLLARGPVVVVYDILPGYADYDGKSIFIPTEKMYEVAAFEKFKQHSVVVTGCGVGLVDGNPIEFWQTHDSQAPTWGVNGFCQLARRNGLIVAAVEFEF